MSKKFNASSVVILIAALCSLAAGVLFQSVGGVFGLMKYNYYNPVIAWGLMGVVAVAVVLMLCLLCPWACAEQIANPWRETTAEEMVETIGLSVFVPEEAAPAR